MLVHPTTARARVRVRAGPIAVGVEGQTDALEDPNLWLEEVDSPEALAWVHAQNTVTLQAFGDPRQSPLLRRLVLTESTDVDQDPLRKLPQVTKIGPFFYDFWSDAFYPRGVWRRTTLEEFAKPEPKWEVLLSLDQLGREEGESWVWRGYVLLDEGADALKQRVMLQLSRGGADAFVAREFDLLAKAFVPPQQGGFVLSEGKSMVCYRERDILLVSTDMGPGSLTTSGYPRTVRAWHRGTPLEAAEVVFEGELTDQIVYSYTVRERGGHAFEVIHRAVSFYEVERHVSIDGGRTFTQLLAPADAELTTFGEHLLLRLDEAYTPPGAAEPFPAGSLLAAPARAALAGEPGCWVALWRPEEDRGPPGGGGTPRFSTLRHVAATKSYLVLVVLARLQPSLLVLREAEGGGFEAVAPGGTEASSAAASVSVRPVDPSGSDAPPTWSRRRCSTSRMWASGLRLEAGGQRAAACRATERWLTGLRILVLWQPRMRCP